MHMDATGLQSADKLSWLATMQHHSVPTRLLDFTYSPYVALYFALRHSSERGRSSSPAIWAIDASAVLAAAKKVIGDADSEEKKYAVEHGAYEIKAGHRVSLDTRFFSTDRDTLQEEGQYWRKALSSALSATGIRRHYYKQRGLVAFALPPVQNRRLSSQQGAFLFQLR